MSAPHAGPLRKWLSRQPEWVREAVVKTLIGLMLGLATAFMLITLASSLFHELEDAGQDAGLAVAVYVDRVLGFASGTKPLGKGDADRYVFLDVDPEPSAHGPAVGPTSGVGTELLQPCAALATTGTARGPLNCSLGRPVNRYVLASMIDRLSEWQARLVVIDVLLEAEAGVVGDDENAALVQAVTLRKNASATVPIVWVDPVESASDPEEPFTDVWGGRGLLHTDAARGLYAAVAIPVPGQPVRRYAKCLVDRATNSVVPTVPFLMARLTSGGPFDAQVDCAEEGVADEANAPRIVYSLPPARSHQDAPNERGRAEWGHYLPVFNRCLGEYFWAPKVSACGQASTYAGKIVVIGASNPARRDRHLTPLGDMAGSEVIINAARSFAAYPHNRDRSYGELLAKKFVVVAWCSLIWLGYFLLSAGLSHSLFGRRHRLLVGVGNTALFAVSVVLVMVTALWISFRTSGPVPSLDVLIPALAVAIDVYVEKAHDVLEWAEHRLKTVLGLPLAAASHKE
jgi:CHASE2 domain-containing sensor protein